MCTELKVAMKVNNYSHELDVSSKADEKVFDKFHVFPLFSLSLSLSFFFRGGGRRERPRLVGAG